jgi:hypothetical protein
MTDQRDAPHRTPSADPDGVRVRGRSGARRWSGVVVVLLLVVATGAFLARQAPGGDGPQDMAPAPADADDRDADTVFPQSGQPHAAPRPARTAARAPIDPNDLASYAVPGTPEPTMGEVIERLHAAGIRTGIGAFNPPGTSPPLTGLVVPEDFPLPEGYVRHYQATDDGQRIEPILMYSPDFQFLDANGNPIAIPRNRVVPRHLAPPGLPLRTVRIPPPLTQGGRS